MNDIEAFISEHPNGSFTQSEAWERVKCHFTHETLSIHDKNGTINGAARIHIRRVPLLGGTVFYAPRGYVCDFHDAAAVRRLTEKAVHLARSYRACMLKIDPMIESDDSQAIQNLIDAGFTYAAEKNGYDTVQCRNNYVLDIKGKTEDAIFSAFHRKYRYNIRLALRHGLRCVPCGPDMLDAFYDLSKETARRDGFSLRSRQYFKRMYRELGDACRLFVCFHGDRPLSAALLVTYAKKSCYVYGASSSSHRELMPNYLMQWEMIRYAIAMKSDLYDFQGIPYYWDITHPNYGVYRFKKGFGGRVVDYAGEFDLVFSPAKRAVLNKGLALLGHKPL